MVTVLTSPPNVIQPLAKLDVSQKAMSHKLALWAAKKLPADHPLLK